MIYSLSDLKGKIGDLCDDAETLSYCAYEEGFSVDVVFGIHDLSKDLLDIFDFIERVCEYHDKKNNIEKVEV